MTIQNQPRLGWMAGVLITAVLVGAVLPTPVEAKKKDKVDVCHYDDENAAFELINISQNAVAKHIANHGDGFPGEAVPNMDGYVFSAGCVPLGFPIITTDAAQSMDENETFVVDIASTDPEGETEGNGLIYGITGGDDSTKFLVNVETGELTFVDPPDFEEPLDYNSDNVYEVDVTIYDSDGLTDSALFMVAVQDVDEVVAGVCSNGAVALSTSPDGTSMICDDPVDATCEQDMATLCPVGWNLCGDLQHNNRNDGWNFAVSGSNPALGEIYCRTFGGAGHLSLGSYNGYNNLGQDTTKNCGFGSSRDSCTATYGCNETYATALCCAPSPLCGNGIVDSVEEECDDGNNNETDACLSSCSYRVPSANGLSGIGCG